MKTILALATTLSALVPAGAQAAHPQGPPSAIPTVTPARVLVMPFDNVKREGKIFWLSEASAVLMTDDLRSLGVDAITRDERRQAFDRLQVPRAASLTDATIIRIAQLVGAASVIVGSLQLEDGALAVHARSIALDTGRVQANVTERGPLPELFATFERVARSIAPASGKPPQDLQHNQPPVAAFEDFIKGLLAETPATAANFLKAALALHPPFDRARLALWDVYSDHGDHQQALAAVQPVAADSALARSARFRSALSQLALKRADDAFATLRALADVEPTATVMNNLGVVQVRRGGSPQSGQPTYFFTKAAEADPGDPDYFFNLGYAYSLDRDAQAAIYWLREGLRRNPADGEAHYVLGAALAVSGSSNAEAAREKELARRLSSIFEQWDKRPANDPLPRGLERLKADIEVPDRTRLEQTMVGAGQRDQRELAQFYLDRGRRLFEQDNDRDAIVELNRVLFLSPYHPEAHLLLGRIRLRNGRVHEAIDALKISLWSAETVEAHVALGQALLETNDPAAARQEAERALALDPASAAAKRLLEQAGPKH